MAGRERVGRAAWGVAALLLIAAVALFAWWSGRDRLPALPSPAVAATTAARDAEALPSPAESAAPLAMREEAEATDRAAAAAAATDATAPAGDDEPAVARTVVLHVRDHFTGEALAAATVRGLPVDGTTMSNGRRLAAPPETELLARGDSPLKLVDSTKPNEVVHRSPLHEAWVAVAGYEVGYVTFDWRSGGERTLELRPAAKLTLVMQDAPSELTFWARLFEVDALVQALETNVALQRRQAPEGSEPTRWQLQLEQAIALLATRPRGEIVATEAALCLQSCTGGRSDARFGPVFSAAEPAEVTGLAAGVWLVLVSGVATVDGAPHPQRHVAVGVVETEPGGSARLELGWRPPLPIARVPFAGRLVFDRGWLEPGMPALPTALTIRSLVDDGSPEFSSLNGRHVALTNDGAPDARSFDAGLLPAGRAVIRLPDWHWATAVEVPVDGTNAARVVVPPPCRVTVRAVAPTPAGPVAGVSVSYAAFDHDSASQPFPLEGESAVRDGAPLTFVVPRGQLQLWSEAEGANGFPGVEEHLLDAPAAEFAVAAIAPSVVAVTLSDGGAVVPFQSGWAAAFEAVVGDRALPLLCWTTSGGDPQLAFSFDGEGPALLKSSAFGPWQAIEPIAIELVRGANAAIVVPVVRAR